MIRTINLTRRFGPLVAVQDLNLGVKEGELFGFLGPNGAGKTTAIRLLIGLLQPTAGTAIVAGHDVQQEPLAVKQAVGGYPVVKWLFAKGGWLPGGLVAAQVAYWGGVRALWAAAVRRLELWEEASAPLQES